MKATVKFRLPKEIYDKAIGGQLRLTCHYSLYNVALLERVLKEIYDVTKFRPRIYKDRYANTETVFIPIETLEMVLVGRKWLLHKLELLAV